MLKEQVKDWYEKAKDLHKKNDEALSAYAIHLNLQQKSDWEWLNKNRIKIFNDYAIGNNHSIWFFNQEVVGTYSCDDAPHINPNYYSETIPYAQRINIKQILRRKEDPITREFKFFENNQGKQTAEWVSNKNSEKGKSWEAQFED